MRPKTRVIDANDGVVPPDPSPMLQANPVYRDVLWHRTIATFPAAVSGGRNAMQAGHGRCEPGGLAIAGASRAERVNPTLTSLRSLSIIRSLDEQMIDFGS
jgi:hypothetical protein